jgi:hypothetical protein
MTSTLGTLVKFCDTGRVNNFVYTALTIRIIIILEILNLGISQDPSMSKSRHEYICDSIYKIFYFPINGKLNNNMVDDWRQTHIAEECNLNVVNVICYLSEWQSEVHICTYCVTENKDKIGTLYSIKLTTSWVGKKVRLSL